MERSIPRSFLGHRKRILWATSVAALLLLAAYKSGGSPPPPPSSVLPAAYRYSLDAGQWAFQHSPGMPSSPAAHPDGGWSFEFPIGPDARGAASVHYLVTGSPGRPTGSRLVVDFEVIGERSAGLSGAARRPEKYVRTAGPFRSLHPAPRRRFDGAVSLSPLVLPSCEPAEQGYDKRAARRRRLGRGLRSARGAIPQRVRRGLERPRGDRTDVWLGLLRRPRC
jgi:hypothetical protein